MLLTCLRNLLNLHIYNDMSPPHVDSDGSQESVTRVCFDDSEEERADPADDGFRIGHLPLEGIKIMIDGKQYGVNRCAVKKIPYRRNFNNCETSVVGDGFVADYESGDLGSSK